MRCNNCGGAVTEFTTAVPLCDPCKHGVKPVAHKMQPVIENKMIITETNKTAGEEELETGETEFDFIYGEESEE